MTKAEREQWISLAQEEYQREGTLEIDSYARVSVSDDGGAYVQAWVWVDNPKLAGKL